MSQQLTHRIIKGRGKGIAMGKGDLLPYDFARIQDQRKKIVFKTSRRNSVYIQANGLFLINRSDCKPKIKNETVDAGEFLPQRSASYGSQ